MATPLPQDPRRFGAFTFAMDCIRKDTPPPILDAQSIEVINGQLADSKLLWSQSQIPFRVINISELRPGNFLSVEDQWSAFQANSDQYWAACPWGGYSGFWNESDFGTNFGSIVFPGGWVVQPGGPGLFPDGPGSDGYVNAACAWQQLSVGTTAPAYGRFITAFQVKCPSLFASFNYEIWQVTGRWQYMPAIGGFTFPDDGYAGAVIPSPYPWSLSTDFQKVSSGTLHPGDIVTVTPHDLNPVGNCQSPPAPSLAGPPDDGWGPGHYSDWDGWAIGRYFAFV